MKADIIPARTPAELFLAEAFESSKASLPGNAQVAQWREGSMRAFSASGLPHRRIESWHYTDLRALMRQSLPLASFPGPEVVDALRQQLTSADAPKQRLVLVDGFFVPELSDALPDGLKARSLASVLSDGQSDLIALLSSPDLGAGDPILSLNAALMQDGVVIEVAPGAAIPEPINLMHVTASAAPAAHFFRSALIIGADASVRFAETCLCADAAGSAPASQANACLIVSLAEGAMLSHTAMISQDLPGSMRLESVMARIGARARLESLALVCGIGLLRRQMFLRLDGEGSDALVNGVSLLAGREHADMTLRIEHAAQRCTSRETFKYILDDEATGVFQGKVRVAPAAQKTNSKMLAKAVLLSDRATMNSKPELEIFADDVVCGHGSTSGGLDKDQLFYLQARGLPFAEAEALLLEAFAGDVIDSIGHDGLINAFRHKVSAWLAARRESPAVARGANDQG
jgi:Fe-S cluster assembly protein SufD